MILGSGSQYPTVVKVCSVKGTPASGRRWLIISNYLRSKRDAASLCEFKPHDRQASILSRVDIAAAAGFAVPDPRSQIQQGHGFVGVYMCGRLSIGTESVPLNTNIIRLVRE